MADTQSIEVKAIEHDCREWSPPDVLRDLPISQAGEGRHKCCTCAYAIGYRAGQTTQCKVGFTPKQLPALIEWLQTQDNSSEEDQMLLLLLEAHL